jgi:hypothetical protein
LAIDSPSTSNPAAAASASPPSPISTASASLIFGMNEVTAPSTSSTPPISALRSSGPLVVKSIATPVT